MIGFKMTEDVWEYTCSTHKRRLKAIDTSPGLQREQRILCEYCRPRLGKSENVFGVEEMRIKIENKLQYLREGLIIGQNNHIQKIEELINTLESIRQSIFSIFDTIKSQLDSWKTQSFDQQKKLYQYRFLEEVQYFSGVEEDGIHKKSFINEIIQNNNSYQIKISDQLNKISNCQEMHRLLNEIQNIEYFETGDQIKQIQNQKSKITIQQIGHIVEQKEQCNAIVFNNEGSIMISNINSQIGVWEFQKGELKLVQTLKGHDDSVQCLFFSKLNNYFISSSDQTIKLWILVDRWICKQTVKLNKGYITCIITDLKENLIIFGSTDYSIQVWEHNYANNLIKICDLIKHDRQVISLSLNLSETLLVSCAEDSAEDKNQIIVWGKTQSQNNPFEFKYFVRQIFKISGPQVKFINDEQFVLISYDNNMVSLFEDCLGELLQNYSSNPERLFPILYNPQKQLLYFRVNSQLQTYISSNGKNLYGSVTNDGQYFVYWDGKNRGYSIFKISYL